MVAAHGRRIHGPAVRAGGIYPAAGGVVGPDIDGMARVSPRQRRGHPAFDRGDRSLLLFFLEIADAAGRRYLADVHVADWICRRRDQYRDAASGRLSGLDD